MDEVGEGVTDVVIGDAVFGYGFNMIAQYAVLRPSGWARKPANLSFEEAGGFPVVVETATRILAQVGVKPGETLSGQRRVRWNRVRRGSIRSNPRDHRDRHGQRQEPRLCARTRRHSHDVWAGPRGAIRNLAPAGVDAALDIAGSGVIPELIELVGDPSRGPLHCRFHRAAVRSAIVSRGSEESGTGLGRSGATVFRGQFPCGSGESRFPSPKWRRRTNSAKKGIPRGSSSSAGFEGNHESKSICT